MRIVIIGGLASRRRGSTRLPSVETATLDITSPSFAADLKSLAPKLVIHCAGPFQDQDYRVALASVACGANYADIADGREFVARLVGAVGPAAEAAGCFAITGASTLPALSSAVVDYLRTPRAVVSAIDTVIAPGQHAPRGAATAAVLSYTGRPFQWWRDGDWRTAYGWQELKREQFSFGGRVAAVCDVPDQELLPSRYPGVQTVTFRAALEVALQHYALWMIAACRRMGLPLPMARWSISVDRVGTWLNWLGSDTGGMMVRIVGADDAGQTHCRTWELVAENNHGPEIPCMAAVILANKLNRGDAFAAGARICMGILGLSDFEAEFARWKISTQVTSA